MGWDCNRWEKVSVCALGLNNLSLRINVMEMSVSKIVETLDE